MPVQYRNFYVGKLINVREEEKKQYEKAQGKMDSAPSKVVKGPNIERRQ
jgi:hypothetical protein